MQHCFMIGSIDDRSLKSIGGRNMSIIEIASLLLLCIFGIAYFSKLIVLSKSNHINANVFGKGNKSKKTLLIEKILKTITFAGVAIWIVNIFLSKATEKYFIRIFENYFISWLGLVATFIGVLFLSRQWCL